MAIIKVTWFFEQNGYGWTESFWRNGANVNDPTIAPAADLYATKRIRCSGRETYLRYVRWSEEGVFRDSFGRTYSGYGLQGDSTRVSDEPNTALLMRWRDAAGTRVKQQFLRGVWDSVVDNGGNYTPTAAFTAAINSYIAEVTNGSWGWYGKFNNIVSPILSVTQDASGLVNIVLTNNVFPGPFPQSTMVRIRGVQGATQINGQHLIKATDATHAMTQRRIAIFPYTALGQLTYQTKQLIVTTIGAPQRIVNRKVGGVFYHSRGRRSARAAG